MEHDTTLTLLFRLLYNVTCFFKGSKDFSNQNATFNTGSIVFGL